MAAPLNALYVDEYPGYSNICGSYYWNGTGGTPADAREAILKRFSYCSSCRADFSTQFILSAPYGANLAAVRGYFGYCVCAKPPCVALATLRVTNMVAGQLKRHRTGRLTTPTDVSKMCNYCATARDVKALKQCGICKTARYCDQECQRKHWRLAHKNGCKPLEETV